MDTKNNPKVTVLLPVYNGAPTLREAVLSILKQSFTDFELLVIDDCSSDNGMAVLGGLPDSRMVLVRNEQNMGLAATLNKGIDMARGELIARMDQDDICLPDRLQRQVTLMDSHPDVALCGCGVEVFYTNGRTHRHYFPLAYATIRVEMLFNSPISHPGAMLRKSVLRSGGYRYDETPHAVEDYDLFSRIIRQHRAVNLPLFLLRYRVSGNNETARAEAPERAAIRKGAITRVQRANLVAAGFQPTPRQLDLHYLLSLTDRMQTLDLDEYPVDEIKMYLYGLQGAMDYSAYTDKVAARRITGKIFLKLIVYRWRHIGGLQLIRQLCSALFWYGVWDTLALRAGYLMKPKGN